jgi:hypothetical protein
MVPPVGLHTERLVLVTKIPVVPLVTIESPEVAVALTFTVIPTVGFVGAGERVTVLDP